MQSCWLTRDTSPEEDKDAAVEDARIVYRIMKKLGFGIVLTTLAVSYQF